jgi:hypothetical protein
MIIGEETDVRGLLATVDALTGDCGKAILGSIGVQVNGRSVPYTFNTLEVRDVLLDSYCQQLAANYIALQAQYGIVYTPELYDPGDIKQAMILKFAVAP